MSFYNTHPSGSSWTLCQSCVSSAYSICCRHLLLYLSVRLYLILSTQPEEEIKGCCYRLLAVYDSVCFTSVGDCDLSQKMSCSPRLCWVCAYELDHTWEGCPIYLCASHFPCNCACVCVDETLAGTRVCRLLHI